MEELPPVLLLGRSVQVVQQMPPSHAAPKAIQHVAPLWCLTSAGVFAVGGSFFVDGRGFLASFHSLTTFYPALRFETEGTCNHGDESVSGLGLGNSEPHFSGFQGDTFCSSSDTRLFFEVYLFEHVISSLWCGYTVIFAYCTR